MLRLARFGVPLGVAMALVIGVQGNAFAFNTTQVAIVNFAFSPASVTIRAGDHVNWSNNSGVTHTSTADGIDTCCPTGSALWKSPNLSGSGGSFDQVFLAAGTYTYHCSIHNSMKGTVTVKGSAKPKTGGATTSFKITWATGVPSGYTFNVQISRPTGGGFTPFLTGTTMLSTMFTPDAGTGTYQFRARLQNGTGGASGYSKPKSITVS